MQNKETYWQEGVWKTAPWPGCREKADNVRENPGLWGRSIGGGAWHQAETSAIASVTVSRKVTFSDLLGLPISCSVTLGISASQPVSTSVEDDSRANPGPPYRSGF